VQVAEARKLLSDGEIERCLNSDRVVAEALRAAQQDGIVFIDEIDKIVETSRGVGGATSKLVVVAQQVHSSQGARGAVRWLYNNGLLCMGLHDSSTCM
jgi:ATP-dependent Clp protease ATP-binding subunit ClpA